MEKKKLKALALLISLSILSYSEEITFKQLTQRLSASLNQNIYLDVDIKDYKVDINIADTQTTDELVEYYKIVLFDHDMYLKQNIKGNFLMVKKVDSKKKRPDTLPPLPIPNPLDKYHYYTYKIKHITNQDVVKTMSIFPKSKFVYLEQSDIISYSCTEEQHNQIERMLSQADNKTNDALIKITIFSTKKDELLSYGSNIRSFNLDIDSTFNSVFDNLLNTQSPSQLTFNKNANIGFTLFAMQGRGAVEILQEPTIKITNGKQAEVSSGLNIAYKESTVSVQENQQTTTDQIRYRDVGISISVFPKIKKDLVYLDLNLVSEELLSLKDNIPLTQKIAYKSSVSIKRGKPVLLTGIKKTSVKFEKDGIPLLSDIPLIGELFKKKTKNDEELNISILIEVL